MTFPVTIDLWIAPIVSVWCFVIWNVVSVGTFENAKLAIGAGLVITVFALLTRFLP